MILTRAPLRISFAGGGTDLPSWARRYPGAVVSAAISQYVYVAVNDKFDGRIRASYSITENVDTAAELSHDLIRESLPLMGIESGLEVVSVADVPAGGGGLGSSSSFTVGLLAALFEYSYSHDPIRSHLKTSNGTKAILAEEACRVEIERCGRAIGKQDQYAAAYGGLNLIRFEGDGVEVRPLTLELATLQRLENNLLLFYTGNGRKRDVTAAHPAHNGGKDRALMQMVHIAERLAKELTAGNVDGMGTALEENWQIKRRLSDGITSPRVDHWHDLGMEAGATGAKLCGSGGDGGFMLFYAPDGRRGDVLGTLEAAGLRPVPFRFDWDGVKVVYQG